jgi:hypothetical protein
MKTQEQTMKKEEYKYNYSKKKYESKEIDEEDQEFNDPNCENIEDTNENHETNGLQELIGHTDYDKALKDMEARIDKKLDDIKMTMNTLMQHLNK